MKLSKRHLALIALTIASIIWGAASPIFKWSMQEIPPYTLAFLRFMLASLFLLPFVYKKIAIKKEDFFNLLVVGFIGITLNIALYLLSLTLTTSINVQIINSATPIFLILGSMWYLHEKLKIKIIIGTLLSMIGIVLIIVQPLLTTHSAGSFVGNILTVLSVLCVVIYTLLLKKLSLPYPTIAIVFWTFFLGSILFIPAFLTELVLFHPFAHFEAKSLIGIAYGSIFSSALAFFFYNVSLKYLSGSEIGIFSYIEPIVTVVVAIPLLGERMTPLFLLGSLIVMLGISIAEGHLAHRHPRHVLLSKNHK